MRTTINDIFAEYEQERRAEMAEQDRIDALPENVARRQAKRAAEIASETARGLRDQNGDWIIPDDEPDEDEPEDDADQPEDSQ